MSGHKGGVVGQAAGAVGGIVAAMLAKKLISIVWVAASGRAVPQDPADLKVSTGEAVVFSGLTGALVGVARLLVQRKTAKATQVRAAEVAAA